MDLLLNPLILGGALGLVIGLAVVGTHSGEREHERQTSSSGGLGGILWCAFVLVAVVGSAWLFNFPHGGDGGRLDGRPGFGGTVFGDVFGLRRDGGR